MLHRAAFLAALVCLAGCGRTPSAPSEPAAARSPGLSYAGDWSGQYRFTACWAERHCNERMQGTEPFALRLRESSVSYEGIFITASMVAEVRGDLDRTGALVLTGTTPAAGDNDETGAIDVHRLILTGNAYSSLTGSIAYARTPGPLSYWVRFLEAGTLEYAADLLSASREGNTLPSFDGQWTGNFVVRACTNAGRSYCYPAKPGVNSLELILTQSGETVSGRFGANLPVTGRVSGNGVLSLEGESETRVSGGGERQRLTGFSAQIDKFGRLVGAFSYYSAYLQDSGVTSSSTYQCDLWQVVSSRPH